MLSKTDYKDYLQNPLHLWAKKHDRLEKLKPTPYEEFLMEQGNEVEKFAEDFIRESFVKDQHGVEVFFQQTYIDPPFQTRLDACIYFPNQNTWDIIEIKSSLSVRKEDIYDATFSYLVCESSINVRSIYLVTLNPDYQLEEKLEIKDLFTATDITMEVNDLKFKIKQERDDAFRIMIQPTSDGIDGCLKPNDCPCPSLCHPNLPEYPIFNIPFLSQKKAKDLIDKRILSIMDIPENYPFSDKQNRHIKSVKKGRPIIDRNAIRDSLSELQYPLQFLDYETYNPAIPKIKGFKPHQAIIFQYSLHIIEKPDADLIHNGFLSDEYNNPEPGLLNHLSQDLRNTGSVLVWNQSFEASRNRELAARYPQAREFLLGMTNRMFDLMEIFRKGYYIHPDFKGSASIKRVFPILAPSIDIKYSDLHVSHGDDAMVNFHKLVLGGETETEIKEKRKALLEYCKLDTLAMVEIWRVLSKE